MIYYFDPMINGEMSLNKNKRTYVYNFIFKKHWRSLAAIYGPTLLAADLVINNFFLPNPPIAQRRDPLGQLQVDWVLFLVVKICCMFQADL